MNKIRCEKLINSCNADIMKNRREFTLSGNWFNLKPKNTTVRLKTTPTTSIAVGYGYQCQNDPKLTILLFYTY